MHTPESGAFQGRLRWVGQFHGPNPLAPGPVLMAEFMVHGLPNAPSLVKAVADWWPQSGAVAMNPAPVFHADPADTELALAKCLAAWTMAFLNAVRGDVQYAGARRLDGGVCLWVGFHQPDISRAALALALKCLLQSVRGDPDAAALQAERDRLQQVCRQHHPDYQARILRVGARSMGVPFLHFLAGTRYWQFGWGAKARVFMESSSNTDGVLGWQWQKSKTVSKALMAALGLPVPAHQLVRREQDLADAVGRIGFPCVVKPLDSGGGKGVTANIRSLAQAHAAFAFARSSAQAESTVMVEAHVAGDDHRLMVIDGQLVAAIRREPSFVVGDGRQPLSALLAQLNAVRSRNMVHSRYLRPIPSDAVLQRHLATQSLTLDDVPVAGRRVTLRSNANLSTGGVCTDVTAVCHPQVRAMAQQLAKTAGMGAAGVDYLTTDITRAPAQTGGTFIEMNLTPGLDVCVAAGWSEASIAGLVLGPSVGRIPIALTVLSAAGVDALREAMAQPPLADGDALVVGDALHIGGLSLRVTTQAPWSAVHAGLRNQTVKRVQVVCAAEEVSRLGLPVDMLDCVDVAVVDAGAVLSPLWRGVLARHSRTAVACEPEPALLRRLIDMGWADDVVSGD